ncbi:MAG: competence/damage-inducible protein A [Clostridia bacterium]|nr:competence/damage-inducible protein A [Clostridia bacterium]
MLTAEIICVGTELLMGQVVNTNATYIAQKLCEIGVAVNYSSVVGDNPERLSECVKEALTRCDVLITTGGLGPTDDDLTKEIVSRVMGKELFYHKESMDKMLSYLKEAGKNMTKNNEKQAYLPIGSIILENDNGTAPGCIIEDGGKCAILLPGPPKEMKPMLEKALGYLREKSGMVMKSRVLRLFGIGESRASALLDDIIKNQTNPTIAPYAKEGEVTFRITASAECEEKASLMVDEMAEKVYAIVGEYIYGEGDDNSMEKVVVDSLNKRHMTLATCESCTGGLIGQLLTKVSGASEVYGFGFVTYANEAKMQLVGVKKETLDAYGAVSEETAREMAEGARRVSGSDIAVSVTGIAGPTGGTEDKPVGLVYIGISDKNGTEAFRFVQSGDRERVRKKSALCALDLVRRRILG